MLLTSIAWPIEGKTYVINLWGSKKAITSKTDKTVVLEDWKDDDSQLFTCTMYNGFMGFLCKGGSKKYLGYNSSETIVCQADYQRTWENFEVRAHAYGGFMLYMTKDKHLAPVQKVDDTTLKMMSQSSNLFGFTEKS